jgi:branched-subunit amino acid aminotransferase/4-amino-4-deoxychorismate lyase
MVVYQKQYGKGSLPLRIVTPTATPLYWQWQFAAQQWESITTAPLAMLNGLQLGYSVFTTFRYPQQNCWLRVHLQRVLQHAKPLGLMPIAGSLNEAFEALLPVLAQQVPTEIEQQGEANIFRLTACFAGDVSLLQPNGTMAENTAAPLPTVWLLQKRSQLAQPFAVQAPHPSLRLSTVAYVHPLSAYKHGNLLPAWQLRLQHIQHSSRLESLADDVIWQNPQGELLETTTANLFFILADGCIYTAPTPSVLAGVTRQQVKKACQQRGIPLMETPVQWGTDTPQVSGAFISNSVQGLVPVFSINQTPLPWDVDTQTLWQQVYQQWIEVLNLARCYSV